MTLALPLVVCQRMNKRDLRADAARGERLRAAPMDPCDVRRWRARCLEEFCSLAIARHVRLTGKDDHQRRFRSVQKSQRREKEGDEDRECEAHGFRS